MYTNLYTFYGQLFTPLLISSIKLKSFIPFICISKTNPCFQTISFIHFPSLRLTIPPYSFHLTKLVILKVWTTSFNLQSCFYYNLMQWLSTTFNSQYKIIHYRFNNMYTIIQNTNTWRSLWISTEWFGEFSSIQYAVQSIFIPLQKYYPIPFLTYTDPYLIE